MSGFLSGKTALVTGGTRGIGRAIAHSLLSEGASVVICGTQQNKVDAALIELRAAGGNVTGTVADVADPEAVSRLFEFADEQSGPTSVLVNNAGIGIFRPVGEITPEEWRRVLGINLDGA